MIKCISVHEGKWYKMQSFLHLLPFSTFKDHPEGGFSLLNMTQVGVSSKLCVFLQAPESLLESLETHLNTLEGKKP